MRATLTIEPDVAAQLRQMQMQRHEPWRTLVNEALREGLMRLREEEDGTEDRTSGKPFQTREADLGQCRYNSIDNVAEVLAVAEGEDFR